MERERKDFDLHTQIPFIHNPERSILHKRLFLFRPCALLSLALANHCLGSICFSGQGEMVNLAAIVFPFISTEANIQPESGKDKSARAKSSIWACNKSNSFHCTFISAGTDYAAIIVIWSLMKLATCEGVCPLPSKVAPEQFQFTPLRSR